jgi:CHAT domain-containing protein
MRLEAITLQVKPRAIPKDKESPMRKPVIHSPSHSGCGSSSILRRWFYLSAIASFAVLLPGFSNSTSAQTNTSLIAQKNEAKISFENGSETTTLELGKPMEREMAGEASHLYSVAVSSGDYLRILINQRGIDVVLSIVSPDGKKLVESNSDNGTYGVEPASLIAQATGSYLVEVRSPEKKAPSGRYDLKIDQLRIATPQDTNRVLAERVFLEGDRLRAPAKPESMRLAVMKYQEALKLLESASDPLIEAQALHGIGRIHSVLGEKPKALEYYLKALPLRRTAGDRRGEATTLNSIGAAYIGLEEVQKALAYLKQSLPIRREIGDRRGEAVTLNNIGFIYKNLGEHERAVEYYFQSLSIRRALNDKESQILLLFNIGLIYQELDDNKTAREYYSRFMELVRSIENRRWDIVTTSRFANIYQLLGDKEKALEYLNRALALARAENNLYEQPGLLIRLAASSHASGEAAKALDFYHQALAISRSIEGKTEEMWSLYSIARIERDRGHFKEALLLSEAALRILESLRSKIEISELRTSYSATYQNLYSFNIDLLMQMHKQDPSKGFAAAAFQVSEQARARTLLELLMEARADIRQGADAALLERERAVQQQLNDQADKLRRLLGGKHTEEQEATARRDLETLKTAYQDVGAQLRTSSPRYAALLQPATPALADIQRQVLDPDTLLLEYALGAERSYLWVVTQTSLASYELPKASEIESASRRVFDLLRARNQHLPFETVEEKRTRVSRAGAEFSQAASALSQMLLGPIATQLEHKRLLIVSEGALQFVPFAALPAPWVSPGRRQVAPNKRQPSQAPYTPLVSEHVLVNLPSATSLALLREELAGRRPAQKTVAVLADPVFEQNDERLTVVRRAGKPSNDQLAGAPLVVNAEDTDLLRAASDSNAEGETFQRIPRLPFTRREADAITALVPSGEHKRLLDFSASRAVATGAELGQYRFVHFATHGFINSKHPELSGIVLSLFDEQGREQDGFLRAHEIFNLKLPVELVVLSGCRTGLGKDIRGEGLIGLTRGFMYAGAARVLVSLWDVNDEATAELMTRFYRAMLGSKKQNPAAALRAAQAEMSMHKRWAAPYYWAGFVLQGEPN